MNTVFRLAVIEDLPALLQLEEQCFTTDRLNSRNFQWMISRANGQLLVAQRDEHLLGYALVLFHRGTSLARLYSIAIAAQAPVVPVAPVEIEPDAEAVAIATGNTAKAHGLDVGILASGRPADIVICNDGISLDQLRDNVVQAASGFGL